MPQRNARPRPTGFTLIEMLCVVTILGIAAAVVLPQIGSGSGVKLSAASRRLMSDLLYAQNRAISTQQRHYFHITGLGTPTQTMQLLAVPLDGGPPAPVKNPVDLSDFTTRFGEGASPGLEGVNLVAATYADDAMMGYDELGAPVTLDLQSKAAGVIDPGTVLRLTCGEGRMTLRVEPMTGDVAAE